ncbi:MAG: hypothetical protein ACRCXT_08795 [Paraclostridium sp.]
MNNSRYTKAKNSNIARKGKIGKAQLGAALLKDIYENNPSGEGNVNIAIKKNTEIITNPIDKVYIGINGFNRGTDTLLVFKNGVYLEVGYDYRINPDDSISNPDGSIWDASEEVPEVFNFVAMLGGMDNIPGMYQCVNDIIAKDLWTLNDKGLYEYLYKHGLRSEKVIAYGVDTTTKEDIFISSKRIDGNTILLETEVANDINILVVNVELNIQEKPAESINTLIIPKEDWVYDETNQEYTFTVEHGLNTKYILMDGYDNDTNERLIIQCSYPDKNNMILKSDAAYNCTLSLVYKTNISLNPIFRINDNINSRETTYSSVKINELIHKMVGGGCIDDTVINDEYTWSSKKINDSIGNKVGDLSILSTENKTNLVEAVNEVFQSGVNVKTDMVQAINSKTTVPDVTYNDPWNTLINRVNAIREGSGNAIASDVLSGKTFTNNDGVEYTGTLNIGGTALTSDVLAGKTFTDDSKTIKTGTMVNRGGAQTITPTTSDRTLSSGYYSGNITVKGDANLKPENIMSGKSIFGITGTAIKMKEGPTPSLHLFNITTNKSPIVSNNNLQLMYSSPYTKYNGYTDLIFTFNSRTSSYMLKLKGFIYSNINGVKKTIKTFDQATSDNIITFKFDRYIIAHDEQFEVWLYGKDGITYDNVIFTKLEIISYIAFDL